MVAVGFSAGPHQGVWAIFVYFFVQNIDGYLVVPYIARRTVDLAPAVVLAMQLLMGALFGILGVLFADPILATLKVVLVDLSRRAGREEGERPERRRRLTPLLLRLLRRLLLPLHQRAARGTTFTTCTSKSRSALGGIGLPAAGWRRSRALAGCGAVAAAFLHPRQCLGEPGNDLAMAKRRGPPWPALLSNTVPSSRSAFIVEQRAVVRL